MASVGEKLRKVRLDRGLDLAQVADQTKIGSRYLDAIERDDRSTLPGGFFYKNWVQQYANFLEMDVASIAADVEQTVAHDAAPVLPGQEKPKIIREQRISPIDIPGARPLGGASRWVYPLAALFCVMLACSGLYMWWHSSQNTQSFPPVAELKIRAVHPPAIASITPSPSSAMPVEPLSEAAHVPATTSTAQPSPPLAPITTESTANLTPIAPDDVRIELSATQATWVSVTPDGKEVFAGVLQPAQIRTVGAHDTAMIRIGNAGGLSVRLNGKSIGPIGPAGQVRTLFINKTGFQIVEPKPAASPVNETGSNDRAPIAPPLSQ